MHPIKHPKTINLNTVRACVSVEREGKELISAGNVQFARADTVWTELPDDYKVVNEDGEEIKPSGKFLISVESIDPYHLVTDFVSNKA
jgi:hypothetical protein